MPAITATQLGNGFVQATSTTLDGLTDTFTFTSSKTQILTFLNNTGGSLDLNINSDGPTSHYCPGVGTIDLTSGVTQTIADGETFTLKPTTIREYLQGDNISLTGGTGITAYLYE